MIVSSLALALSMTTVPGEPASSDKATVYVYRKSRLISKLGEPTIYWNGHPVAEMDNGRYFSLELDAGRHTVSLGGLAGKSVVDVELRSSEEHFISVNVGIRGKFSLQVVTADNANREIAELKPLAVDNVKAGHVVSIEPYAPGRTTPAPRSTVARANPAADGATAARTAAGQTPALQRMVVAERPVTMLEGKFKIGTLTVGPDGRRFAWALQVGSAYRLEVDGKLEGTQYEYVGLEGTRTLESEDIERTDWEASTRVNVWDKTGLFEVPGFKPVIFSDDGQHLAFRALRKDKKWVVVHDGREGKPYEGLAGGPVMSRDGQRLAYAAKTGQGWRVVLDGVEGKLYEKVGPPVFSPDGKKFAHAARLAGKEMMVADGVEGRPYESLDVVSGIGAALWFHDMIPALPTFSVGGRLAYYGKRAGKWHVVLDGEEGEAFEEIGHLAIGDLAFSPDGKRLAFRARRTGQWTVVVDGQAQGSYKDVSAPVFSPDGARMAFVGELDGGKIVVVDGKPIATHEDVILPTFSHDGRRMAYVARAGNQWKAVVDGVAHKAYIAVTTPVFSPDASHVAYGAALAADRWTIVVDGGEGKVHRGLVKGGKLVFDGHHRLHYLAIHENQIVLVEEELQSSQ